MFCLQKRSFRSMSSNIFHIQGSFFGAVRRWPSTWPWSCRPQVWLHSRFRCCEGWPNRDLARPPEPSATHPPDHRFRQFFGGTVWWWFKSRHGNHLFGELYGILLWNTPLVVQNPNRVVSFFCCSCSTMHGVVSPQHRAACPAAVRVLLCSKPLMLPGGVLWKKNLEQKTWKQKIQNITSGPTNAWDFWDPLQSNDSTQLSRIKLHATWSDWRVRAKFLSGCLSYLLKPI